MENTTFVYFKDSKIKCLDFCQGQAEHKKMIADGWLLTASLNPCLFLENLFNECSDKEKIQQINELIVPF